MEVSFVTDDETHQRVVDELRRVTAIIEQVTGLQSRWNGTVELVPEAEFRGLKPFRCDILLDARLAFDNVRWRTMIHEVLHSVSAGYNSADFNNGQGWEEGVVKSLQRLLRGRILSALGVTVDEFVFDAIEKAHSFNRYIEALEDIRKAFQQSAEDFYLSLLRVPIKSRHGFLMQQALVVAGERRKMLLSVLSASRAVLEAKSR